MNHDGIVYCGRDPLVVMAFVSREENIHRIESAGLSDDEKKWNYEHLEALEAAKAKAKKTA